MSWSEHLTQRKAVLNSFRTVGMTLRLAKCKFGRGKVKYIGHEIGSGTRTPLLDKIDAIVKIPEPKTKKMLRSFLGAIGFYKNYLQNFSSLALPLTELTKNKYGNTVHFNEEQSKAFDSLKQALCNYTCLFGPRYDRPFIIRCDASDTSVGSSLSQLDDDGVERPLAFVSAKLTDAQLNWAIVHREAYALIHALKKFEVYVYGSKIDVFMDHNPLTYVVNNLPNCARLCRWALALAKFDLVIHHIKGVENSVADWLSRA